MKPIEIKEDTFEAEVTQAQGKVLVDFWAPWCGPCRRMAPVVEALAEERPDIKVGKVNVDEEGALAERFGVMGIPTLVLFENGTVLRQTSGAMPRESVLTFLDAEA